ncbi:hypothetical protein [Desulfobacula sp.]|uniref:hypothetical protein n=1 Tax=Desulfobacula sp. TaxID=2593537 RepID=UPI00261C373D|nr:hypothetical protein [Desulfobacula sp.]
MSQQKIKPSADQRPQTKDHDSRSDIPKIGFTTFCKEHRGYFCLMIWVKKTEGVKWMDGDQSHRLSHAGMMNLHAVIPVKQPTRLRG